MAEADEFAVDSAVAPGRVLGREAQDESANLSVSGWSSRSSSGVRSTSQTMGRSIWRRRTASW